jgi:GT2 family glycosyltransferase
MSYRLFELEVTEPLRSVTLAADEAGYGLIMRRKGRVVGFVMHHCPPGARLSAEELAEIVGQVAGTKLLEEAIREELEIPTAPDIAVPSLTVAICTKDRPDLVERCLRSIEALDPASIPWTGLDVLVVDNAPSDEHTARLVAGHAGVRRVVERKPGLDFARNCALREARGDLVAFLDDDVVVDRNWLAGLYEAWTENPDAGAFTGLVLPYELATEAQILFERRGGFRRGFDKVRHGSGSSNPLYPCGAGSFGAGCNAAFRRDVLLRLGGFDEALDTGAPLPGGGDLDIFYRVIRAGYPIVYEPQYLVFHQHRRELDKLRRQYWSWGLGFMAFVAKSYRIDRPLRPRFRRLVLWWVGDQLKQLSRSLLRQHPLPPSFLLAELGGGVIGLCGEYSRSNRRVERIRKALA